MLRVVEFCRTRLCFSHLFVLLSSPILCHFERTRPTASMRTSCLIYHSLGGETYLFGWLEKISKRGAYSLPVCTGLVGLFVCCVVSAVAYTIDCEICTSLISTNPAPTEVGKLALTRCFLHCKSSVVGYGCCTAVRISKIMSLIICDFVFWKDCALSFTTVPLPHSCVGRRRPLMEAGDRASTYRVPNPHKGTGVYTRGGVSVFTGPVGCRRPLMVAATAQVLIGYPICTRARVCTPGVDLRATTHTVGR